MIWSFGYCVGKKIKFEHIHGVNVSCVLFLWIQFVVGNDYSRIPLLKSCKLCYVHEQEDNAACSLLCQSSKISVSLRVVCHHLPVRWMWVTAGRQWRLKKQNSEEQGEEEEDAVAGGFGRFGSHRCVVLWCDVMPAHTHSLLSFFPPPPLIYFNQPTPC